MRGRSLLRRGRWSEWRGEYIMTGQPGEHYPSYTQGPLDYPLRFPSFVCGANAIFLRYGIDRRTLPRLHAAWSVASASGRRRAVVVNAFYLEPDEIPMLTRVD
jgi:hypothetical protein